MELVVLGSGGGPQPNPDRASPALAVVHDGSWYAVDAGNGVARQAVRAGLALRDLRGVFVTHHHVDHTADLGNLPHLAWTAGLVDEVVMAGPPPMARLVDEWVGFQRIDVEHREYLGRPSLRRLMQPVDVVDDGVVHTVADLTVTAAHVEHPPLDAVGYRFETAAGSIAISGDTAHCQQMVELATGASVLVHEAYSPDDLHLLTDGTNAAVERLRHHFAQAHTSAEDAGRVAAQAGVDTLVLWHLIPTTGVSDQTFVEQAARTFGGTILAAADLTRIPLP